MEPQAADGRRSCRKRKESVIAPSIASLAEKYATGKFLFFTGSGMSVTAGMSTFTKPGGLYERACKRFRVGDGMRLFTHSFYQKNRDAAEGFLKEIYDEAVLAKPTASHRALCALERAGRLARHYTLNIDGLAAAAGSSLWDRRACPQGATVEMHGNVREMVCTACCARYERASAQGALASIDAGDRATSGTRKTVLSTDVLSMEGSVSSNDGCEKKRQREEMGTWSDNCAGDTISRGGEREKQGKATAVGARSIGAAAAVKELLIPGKKEACSASSNRTALMASVKKEPPPMAVNRADVVTPGPVKKDACPPLSLQPLGKALKDQPHGAGHDSAAHRHIVPVSRSPSHSQAVIKTGAALLPQKAAPMAPARAPGNAHQTSVKGVVKRPEVCTIPGCQGGPLRSRVMLYDDKDELSVVGPEVMSMLEDDIQAADAIIWAGISFQQSASVEYFRRVRRILQEQGRASSVPQLIVNPSDDALFNLVTGVSNFEELSVTPVLATCDEFIPLLAPARPAGAGSRDVLDRACPTSVRPATACPSSRNDVSCDTETTLANSELHASAYVQAPPGKPRPALTSGDRLHSADGHHDGTSAAEPRTRIDKAGDGHARRKRTLRADHKAGASGQASGTKPGLLLDPQAQRGPAPADGKRVCQAMPGSSGAVRASYLPPVAADQLPAGQHGRTQRDQVIGKKLASTFDRSVGRGGSRGAGLAASDPGCEVVPASQSSEEGHPGSVTTVPGGFNNRLGWVVRMLLKRRPAISWHM